MFLTSLFCFPSTLVSTAIYVFSIMNTQKFKDDFEKFIDKKLIKHLGVYKIHFLQPEDMKRVSDVKNNVLSLNPF